MTASDEAMALPVGDDDPLRAQLLDAASRVFASKGYSGAKVMDIVREARLSSGAVYGRFTSKNELLTEAVVRATVRHAVSQPPEEGQVADLLVRSMTQQRGPLSDREALQLEAYVAARREDDVAAALEEARRLRRARIEPIVQAALDDGTASPELDIESVLYFMEAVHVGLLAKRGAGMEPPPADRWEAFVTRIVRALAASNDPDAAPAGG